MSEKNYFGNKLNLLPKAQQTATARSNLIRTNGDSTAILILDVTARAAGSITDIKLYLKSLDGHTGAASDIAVYTFAALGIIAPGVYAFLISPQGGAAAGWTAAPIAGVVPPEFVAEVVLAGGSDLTFSLWAMLVDS